MDTIPRFTIEPHTYQWATEPDHWYVWDNKQSAQFGGKHSTPESAQADADKRNEKAAASC